MIYLMDQLLKKNFITKLMVYQKFRYRHQTFHNYLLTLNYNPHLIHSKVYYVNQNFLIKPHYFPLLFFSLLIIVSFQYKALDFLEIIFFFLIYNLFLFKLKHWILNLNELKTFPVPNLILLILLNAPSLNQLLFMLALSNNHLTESLFNDLFIKF